MTGRNVYIFFASIAVGVFVIGAMHGAATLAATAAGVATSLILHLFLNDL